MNVGQAVDREVVLNDIELVTGSRPAASRYDERKWSDRAAEAARRMLSARSAGRARRPAHLTRPRHCPRSCWTKAARWRSCASSSVASSAPMGMRPSCIAGASARGCDSGAPGLLAERCPGTRRALKQVMDDLLGLLARCGVKTDGANIYEYPTRRAASSYPAAQDGLPRDGGAPGTAGRPLIRGAGGIPLLRGQGDAGQRGGGLLAHDRPYSPAALWMSARLEELHQADADLSFSRAREVAAVELMEREPWSWSPHYALLAGHDRFSRLPQATARKFQPLHRESCRLPLARRAVPADGRAGVVCAAALACGDGRRQALLRRERRAGRYRHSSFRCWSGGPAGNAPVFDLAVDDLHAFVAGTVAVHNCIGNSGPLPEPVLKLCSERRRPRGGGRALRQPQLRGAHPPAGARQLSRLAAAGRRLRSGRHAWT